MKKKIISILGTVTLTASMLAGCGSETPAEESAATETTVAEATVEETAAEETSEATEETTEETSESTEEASEGSSDESEVNSSDSTEASSESADASKDVVRVGSLKGPTTMGIVNLMSESEAGTAEGSYEFTMSAEPSEVMASMVAGDLDIAMVPSNVAAVMNNKVEGGVSVIDINTLGVLYCVTGDDSITSIADLSGKTVLTTGQGATPEYTMNYLLEQNGVTDCTLEFKSEATEIAALLAEDSDQIAILPQPFVTVAEAQNEELATAFSLTDEWDAVSDGSQLITGVTVVTNSFLEEHQEEVELFIKEHEESAELAASDVATTAELVAQYGIIEKAPVAEKAIPYCNIVCITGEDMKTALSGFLEVLYEQDPTSVGGSLPSDDFYFIH
jgi:NitT/TauT family transport system substrate-binding protein